MQKPNAIFPFLPEELSDHILSFGGPIEAAISKRSVSAHRIQRLWRRRNDMRRTFVRLSPFVWFRSRDSNPWKMAILSPYWDGDTVLQKNLTTVTPSKIVFLNKGVFIKNFGRGDRLLRLLKENGSFFGTSKHLGKRQRTEER